MTTPSTPAASTATYTFATTTTNNTATATTTTTYTMVSPTFYLRERMPSLQGRQSASSVCVTV